MRVMSLDLETLGNEGGCVIPAIGYAITVNGKLAESGCLYPNLQEQFDIGMHVNEDTLKWWFKASEQARERTFMQDSIPVTHALKTLKKIWYEPVRCSYVLGYGASFDPPVLEAMYKVFDVPVPWRYQEIMCLRTLCKATGTQVDRTAGTHHDAESDAIQQAKAFSVCMKKLEKLLDG